MELIRQIALYKFLGLPVVAFGGMFTIILLLSTATLGYLISEGKIKLSINWHKNLARVTVVFALVHGFFAMSLFL